MLRVFLLLALLLPAPALAMHAPRLDVRVHPLPSALRAGETVVLTWDELPEGVEELELLLSLDDGRRFTIRISPELDGRTRQWLWKVPNLAAERARLVVRAGGEDGEREGVPSAAFRIESRAGEPAELDQFHEGEWWDGFERGGEAEIPPGTLASAAGFSASREGTAFPSPPDSPSPGRGRPTRMAGALTDVPAPAESHRVAFAASSRRVPLRN